MQVLFLGLQYHFYSFIDRGIISGILYTVSSKKMVYFNDKVDISFLIAALLSILSFTSYIIYYISSKAVKIHNGKKKFKK